MKLHLKITLALGICTLSTAACTESKQTGAVPTKQPAPTTDDHHDAPNDTPQTPPSKSDCDPDKDFHKLDFPEDVTDCHADEKMYNFDKKKCTKMWTSTFDCNYKSVRKVLKSLEVPYDDLDEQEDAGLKLIGCGQSNNGFTIVTQHWLKSEKASKSDCSYDKQGKVVTICYKKLSTEGIAMTPSNEEARKEFVAKCMVP